MWKRHSPETFLGQTRQEKQQIALDNSPSTVKSVVYASMKYKAQDSQDAQTQAAKTQAIIASNPNMSEADKLAVTEMMRSRVSMSFGTRAESKTATKVEIEENTILIADSKTYKYELCQVENTPFIISGKVDRVEQVGGELYLVEIKNRVNRLFFEVPGTGTFFAPFMDRFFYPTLIPLSPSFLSLLSPWLLTAHGDNISLSNLCGAFSSYYLSSLISSWLDYENIQVQTYLQMLPQNVQRAKLIEQYQTETNTMLISRDEMLWGEIKIQLVDFCTRLHTAMNQK